VLADRRFTAIVERADDLRGTLRKAPKSTTIYLEAAERGEDPEGNLMIVCIHGGPAEEWPRQPARHRRSDIDPGVSRRLTLLSPRSYATGRCAARTGGHGIVIGWESLLLVSSDSAKRFTSSAKAVMLGAAGMMYDPPWCRW